MCLRRFLAVQMANKSSVNSTTSLRQTKVEKLNYLTRFTTLTSPVVHALLVSTDFTMLDFLPSVATEVCTVRRDPRSIDVSSSAPSPRPCVLHLLFCNNTYTPTYVRRVWPYITCILSCIRFCACVRVQCPKRFCMHASPDASCNTSHPLVQH